MARDFYINGESLVTVKGNGALGLNGNAQLKELGLTSEAIRIEYTPHYQNLYVNDFGPVTPVEKLVAGYDLTIKMSLVHFDRDVLHQCLVESTGGFLPLNPNSLKLAPFGTPLGGYKQLFTSGCHYISVSIIPVLGSIPWRFRASFLRDNPFEFPLGTERSIVLLDWGSIPYSMPNLGVLGEIGTSIENFEILSSGAIVWDHNIDVIGQDDTL